MAKVTVWKNNESKTYEMERMGYWEDEQEAEDYARIEGYKITHREPVYKGFILWVGR